MLSPVCLLQDSLEVPHLRAELDLALAQVAAVRRLLAAQGMAPLCGRQGGVLGGGSGRLNCCHPTTPAHSAACTLPTTGAPPPPLPGLLQLHEQQQESPKRDILLITAAAVAECELLATEQHCEAQREQAAKALEAMQLQMQQAEGAFQGVSLQLEQVGAARHTLLPACDLWCACMQAAAVSFGLAPLRTQQLLSIYACSPAWLPRPAPPRPAPPRPAPPRPASLAATGPRPAAPGASSRG
jgi:hypothetical protein